MSESLSDILCTRCALCCDGTLFADVELTGRAEAALLEVMGLEVEDESSDAGLLSQPCAALQGRRCGIYAQRPKCCRVFRCQLLQDAEQGALTVAEALAHIADAQRRLRRVEALLAACGASDRRLPLKERCAEALSRDTGAPPRPGGTRETLRAEMAAIERLIWRRFLGSGRERPGRDPRPERKAAAPARG